MFREGQLSEGSARITETADPDVSSAPVTPVGRVSGDPGLGKRVGSVLDAAEAAADQILDDAHKNAEGLLDAAEREAEQVRAATASYDADTRAEVDSYASDRRREVDQQVGKLLLDGEAQARVTRQAAEAMARQIEEEGSGRAQALPDESNAVEERLRKALMGLRRMTAEIEQLVGGPSDDGESLVDALKPYGQQRVMQAEPLAARPGRSRS